MRGGKGEAGKMEIGENGNRGIGKLVGRKKRGVSYSCRTATTSYLCYIPVLEESEGAGRRRLTPAAKVIHYSKTRHERN